jgi:hypothetical protein
MMNKKNVLFGLLIALFMASCKEDEQLITPDLDLIYKVKSTEILLRENTWDFNDLIIDVKYEMQAIPLLANVADENGMVQPGKYSSLDIFGNDNRQKFYTYQFSTTKISRDTTGTGAYEKMGFYNVLSSTEINLNPDSVGSVIYNYEYLDNEGIFKMTSDNLTNGKFNNAMNQRIADAILSGKPDDIANFVVDKILDNENLQAKIQQLLYDLIHGKIDAIAQNPEEVSAKLAEIVLQKLKEVDWETLVYNKLVELLTELQIENPEEKAQELAIQIANRIETNFSQADIYNAILPILQNFENETLPTLVPAVAEAIYGVISSAFSEENIYNKIYPIWTSFSQVDSTTIVAIADTLGTVLTNHFFDADNLTNSLVPFIETLRNTSTVQIPALAQDIIDEVLIPLVDSLNATFPDLNLEPDWNNIKPILTSTLTLIKSSIGSQTNEEAAAALAESIIGIMDLAISKAFETAIFHLQDIPAEQASQVIAAWINNLIVVAEPQIVAFLTEKLNEVAELYNAEDVAENLSSLIHDKITEIFSVENIYDLIYPLMEQLSEIDIEVAAQKITDWLLELGLIKDNITEEQALAALTEIINQLIGNINVDEASQKLVDLILQSNIVQNIDGNVLKQVIEIKTYNFLIDLGKDINAIDTIELSIKKQ